MLFSLSNVVPKFYQVCCRFVRHNINRGMAHSPSIDHSSRIVWIDLELTGLDPEKDVVLEVACVITEANLDEIGERLNFVINQPSHILEAMGEWCQENHRKSGLYGEVMKSSLTIQDAEIQLLEYLNKHTAPGECCLAGNTVYMDRLFLAKYLPTVNNHIHYRIIDVSSIKELMRRWNREIYLKAPQKLFIHRALEDILESIEELKYYKENLFGLNSKIKSIDKSKCTELSSEIELDDLALRILTLMNEFISSKKSIENYIRSGCLDLAKARYIVGNRNISALQLPRDDSVGVTAKFRIVRSSSEDNFPKFLIIEGDDNAAKTLIDNLEEMNLFSYTMYVQDFYQF